MKSLNKKNQLLIIAYILSLVLCYFVAIVPSLEHYSNFVDQEKTLEELANINSKNSALLQKEKQLNDFLIEYKSNEMGSFQNELLHQINTYSTQSGITIIAFDAPHEVIENGLKTSSYLFKLKGDFKAILETLNQIENTPNIGLIKNLNFIKNKNYRTGKYYLTASVILEKKENI